MLAIARTFTLAAALFGGSGPLVADEINAQFNVSISGFPVGKVSYEGEADDSSYKIQGFMGSTGFFGLFIGTRYSGAAIGSFRGDLPAPEVFRGRFEQRRQFAQVDIRYNNGLPISVERIPPRPAQPFDATAADARNHVDPISALYHLLRERPQSELCTQSFGIFEGSRTGSIQLSRATVDSNGEPLVGRVICNGVYRRDAGFSPEQLAERNEFPFTITFIPTEGDLHVAQEFLAVTEFGLAKAVRRN